MPIVINKDFSTEYYIFEKLWWCRVPFNQSRSVEHIKHFGTPMSGDLERDKATAAELVDRMITIETMVTYWKNGVHVYVKNRNECKDIYEAISLHLQGWKRHLESSLNVGDAPLQDLVDLDQFANIVYSHAKYQFTNQWVEDVLHRHISSSLKVSRGNMFVKKQEVVTVTDNRTDEEKLAEQYPDRSDMSDIFARRLQTGSLNRGLVPQQRLPNQGERTPTPGISDKWK
jgi:hypothetical protein